MTLPLRVLGDRILVQPDEDLNAPELLPSGIHVARTLGAAVTGTDKTFSVQRGTVLAVGTPRHPLKEEAESLALLAEQNSPLTIDDITFDDWLNGLLANTAHLLRRLVRKEPGVTVGDDVLFNHDAGQSITLEHHRYIILHEHELLAVVEPEEELCPTT